MPMNRKHYPPNWEEISDRIRFDRAGGCCEQCNAPHNAMIVRSSKDMSQFLIVDPDTGGWLKDTGTDFVRIKWSEAPEEYMVGEAITVVLTTAHLNHDTTDNREENLRALCQRCHLKHDGKLHAGNAARTRRAKARSHGD